MRGVDPRDASRRVRPRRALADEAREHLAQADAALVGHPDVRTSGPLHDAKKELAEAWLTLALVRDDPLPTPDELGIDIAPYCNGLAEAASELRRQLLDRCVPASSRAPRS